MSSAAIRRLQRKLERAELEHLREHCAELAARLEESERGRAYAEDNAEFWHDNSMRLQDAINSDEGASHRAVGMNKAGELMVVRLDS